MSKELDYGEVMESYADKAEKAAILSEDPCDAWLDIDGVLWPNPLYCGEEVKHPDLK
jgi:hypothetical protein